MDIHILEPLDQLTSHQLLKSNGQNTVSNLAQCEILFTQNSNTGKGNEMVVMNGGAEKPHGVVLSSDENEENPSSRPYEKEASELGDDVTLYVVSVRLIESISDQNSGYPMATRIKKSFVEAAPMFRKATMNTRREVLLWARGSPLRALLVVSVGIATLLALTGMLVFMVVFVAATVNAIVISLLISFAAIGGFLAIFFACMTAMYLGLLFITAFVTFTVTISSIIAALVAAGWIGFIWMIWLAASKSARVVKRVAYAANASEGGRCYPLGLCKTGIGYQSALSSNLWFIGYPSKPETDSKT
ncbi:hypothetical protein L1987_46563 [Smallanthus sonchifolius]|uniref:Uncharacterized protein n=1 Tax=Smallanthus sonchifolius TaxID=185202 RepID=A0ACB9FZS6_9ASTR|nr:hypothetical protein L1987_46563 [Smallanthus sonchifolius]